MSGERSSLECGGTMRRFENAAFTVAYAGRSDQVGGLAGWRCDACGEFEFEPDSARRYAEAGDRLVAQAREQRRHEVRRIRRKLGLTQRQAAALTGGGHNAFSRYERGEAEPMPAVVNLLQLLDRHPDLLAELDVVDAGGEPSQNADDPRETRSRRSP